jgi:DNA-binding MarR family transcriptional regulator
MQQLTEQESPAVASFGRILRAHAAMTRQLNAELVAEHGLTVGELEVLLMLAQSPERSMRRIDLAQEVLLSPSGITRMLDRLGALGLVAKASCASDARVSYAVLTDQGVAKLRSCSGAHFAAVDRIFSERFEPEELKTLVELLSRLPGAESGECPTPPA